MKDLFSRAREIHAHAQGGALGQQQSQPSVTGAHGAPGRSPGPVSNQVLPTGNFGALAKQLGIGHVKLDKNPVIARAQLMKHLEQKFGPQYMSQKGVRELLAAYAQGQAKPTDQEVNALDSQATRTVKTLLGG